MTEFRPPRPWARVGSAARRLILALAGKVVPRGRRAAWRAEWESEVWHHVHTEVRKGGWAELSATIRCFGAIRHAMWIRREGWTMDSLWQDVRFAARALISRPGFSLLSAVTLALGIGATTAVFGVVNGVLLEPLPFDDADELVAVWHHAPAAGYPEIPIDPGLYFTYRDEARVFEDIGTWQEGEATVTGLAEPEQVLSITVTQGLLPLLRIEPVLGRRFSPEDDAPGAPLVVMLGHSFWVTRFGSAADVIGRMLRVDGVPHEVIGVAPPGLAFPQEPAASLYLPARFDPAAVRIGNFNAGKGIARLLPGTSVADANADIERMIPMAVERFGGMTLPMLEGMQFGANVRPLERDYVGDTRAVLWTLLGAVGAILLIACANVANLFLVRSEGRMQELATRTAVGATRGRLLRQLLGESVIVAMMAAAMGTALAVGALRIITALGAGTLPRLEEISLDPRVIGFALALSLGSSLLLALVPAFRAGRLDLASSLREGGRAGTAGRARHRTRNLLVVSQLALALVLLAGSGLMLRSFAALRATYPGFEEPEDVLTFRVSVPVLEGDRAAAEIAAVYEEISSRIRDIPGVSSVGASNAVPLDGRDPSTAVWVEDAPVPADQAPPVRHSRRVTGDYFETIANPVVRGRSITWEDVRERRPVAVVSRSFAETYWDGPAEAIGRRIARGSRDDLVWREIVGVVEDERADGLARPPSPVVYWPMAMVLRGVGGGDGIHVERDVAFVVRSDSGDPVALLSDITAAVWDLNPNLPVADVRTLEELRREHMARTSFAFVMLAIASGMALLLGVVGVYGSISYVMAQRTRETGVRLALGASRADVTRMVLRHGAWLAGVGVGSGLVAAVAVTRLMESLLHGVEPTDPLTLVAVSVLLATVAVGAACVPAMRASRVDPVEALRLE